MRSATITVTLSLVLFLVSACASSIERRDPTGERFPTVNGTSLSGREVKLPDDFAGAPLLLLVGYVMETQFDLDRWLVGITQVQLDVPTFEVPTIEGMVPGLFAGQIDAGMRSGIPQEDWGNVITVYGDADKIVRLTGNEAPRNGRILLLDATGTVVFFHDRGFSAGTLARLQEAVARLREE